MYNYLGRERDKYIEKPVTSDEKNIAALIDIMESAISAGDLQNLLSIISESAKIAVSAGEEKALNKAEYKKYMTTLMPQVRRFLCSDIIIRVKGDIGVIHCLGRSIFKNGAAKIIRRYFKCKKDNDKWLIDEAGYA